MIRVELNPLGPRVWVGGIRIHHWSVGAMLVALGSWLIYDDRRDLPLRAGRS